MKGVAVILVLLAALTMAGQVAVAEENPLYPCVSCHAQVGAKPGRTASVFHGVNLTGTSHEGVTCSSCHDPESKMMLLRGGVNISTLLFGDRSDRMVVYATCQQCHSGIVEDWLVLAHGNATYTCTGGETVRVQGYQGVAYYLHDCPEGSEYKAVPAQSCVDCHNPHDPTMEPLSILPPTGERPEPPEQDSIVLGGIGVVLVGLGLILAAPIVHSRSGR